MDALEYIIEVTVCSGLFLALYRWLISGCHKNPLYLCLSLDAASYGLQHT